MTERHECLLRLLRERGEVSLTDLVSELQVSEATVRRDLTALETAGELTRTFGGARPKEPVSLTMRTFGEKRETMSLAKACIGRRAAELVSPGMTVALDSGTTTWRVAEALKEKAPLRIITNALPVIEELGAVEDMAVFCVGGRFNLANLDFQGSNTIAEFGRFHVDIAFVGIDSLVPERGAFADTQEDAAAIGAIRNIADRVIVVTDHSKVNARGLFLSLRPAEIDCVVTDAGLSDQTAHLLNAEAYDLIVAE